MFTQGEIAPYVSIRTACTEHMISEWKRGEGPGLTGTCTVLEKQGLKSLAKKKKKKKKKKS